MIVLALDTTSEYGGAGLFRDGECLASATAAEYAGASNDASAALDYSVIVFQMAERLFAQTGLTFHDVTLFAVASGPGSFTGIRVGVSAVQAWGYVLQRPVFGVSVLEAMAEEAASETDWIVPIMDARRGEFFVAAFRRAGRYATIEAQTFGPEESILRDALSGAVQLAQGSLSGSQTPVRGEHVELPGCNAVGLNVSEGYILTPEVVKQFVAAVNTSGNVTCITREHDVQAQALRAKLVAEDAVHLDASSSPGPQHLGSSPDQQPRAHGAAFPVRWQTISQTLVRAIGRLALRASEEGRLQSPAELDAFYIRRPNAEIRSLNNS